MPQASGHSSLAWLGGTPSAGCWGTLTLPTSRVGRTASELERGQRVFGRAALEPVHCVTREAGYLLQEFMTHFKIN